MKLISTISLVCGWLEIVYDRVIHIAIHCLFVLIFCPKIHTIFALFTQKFIDFLWESVKGILLKTTQAFQCTISFDFRKIRKNNLYIVFSVQLRQTGSRWARRDIQFFFARQFFIFYQHVKFQDRSFCSSGDTGGCTLYTPRPLRVMKSPVLLG